MAATHCDISEFLFAFRGEGECGEMETGGAPTESENAALHLAKCKKLPREKVSSMHRAEPALIKCEKVCPIIAQPGDFESENNRFSCQLPLRREKSSATKGTSCGIRETWLCKREKRREENCAMRRNSKSDTIDWLQSELMIVRLV
jgi:hypothetical protein